MFARQFKPTIGPDAAEQLVEYYKSLRQRDSGGSSKTAWRITVRQLESMLRLSEAYARMRCCDIITKAHVDEAYRLLNKSIIRVEQPDIHLGEEEEDLVNADDEEDEANNLLDGSQPHNNEEENIHRDRMDIDDDLEPLSPQPQQKKKLRLNYDEYKSISNLIIMYMRREENRLEEEGSESEGLKRSQVVNWYLSEIEDEIETEAELIEKKELIEKVLDRLIHHDQVIIALAEAGSDHEDDPIIIVHPNYVVDF
jgi:DNA replication licensing factor MCM6